MKQANKQSVLKSVINQCKKMLLLRARLTESPAQNLYSASVHSASY